MTPTDHRPHMTLTQRLVQNWIGLAGVVVVGASFFAFALLMAIDLSLGFDNPYLGIFTYLVAPFFLVLGLLLMAAGVLVEHIRRLRHAAEEVPRFPRLDFNSPRQRKAFGLAALRVGYAVASPELARELDRRRDPAPVAGPAARIAAARRKRALYALGFPAFRRVWLGGVLSGLAKWMERLAVGWLVLNETGSVFLAALSFAVRAAPSIVLQTDRRRAAYLDNATAVAYEASPARPREQSLGAISPRSGENDEGFQEGQGRQGQAEVETASQDQDA